MSITLPAETARKIFNTAMTAPLTHWARTNLGDHIEVSLGTSSRYTVEIHSSRRFLADVVWASDFGGTDGVTGAHATLAEHRLLMARADAARHAR
ncbi:hypothetical protein [Streptomyces abikoensis]|uniref:Uncharacterized protein n=1 Tax=Streptomyces abikoensis TaxID=97398 RepID=A0ABW7T6N4_9ACTN